MRLMVSIFLAVGWLFMCPVVVRADDPNAIRWQSVERIKGSHECRKWSVKSRNEHPFIEKGYEEEVVSANFVLVPAPDEEPGNRYWITEEAYLTGHSSLTHEDQYTWWQKRQNSHGSFSATAQDLHFDISTTDGTWTFSTGGNLDTPYTVRKSFFSREHHIPEGWVTESHTETESTVTYPHSVIDGKLPKGEPRPISGITVSSEEMPDHWITGYIDCRVWLTPVIPELEVVVTIEGRDVKGNRVAYPDWLPEAVTPPEGADDPLPKVPGSRLHITARLQTDTGGRAQVEVKRFTFKLNDTSREPYISMNWPTFGESDPPLTDLRFEQTGGGLGLQGQSIILPPLTDAQGKPSATATVGSYDFGGWSDLTVEVELADGRVITGHLEGDRRLTLIPLPKRTGGSFIADAWKKQHSVTSPDRADDETEPDGEPGCDGDGLTQYEEYRGFFVGGRHVRGDPKRKELFIYNECGAVAEPGIALFQRLSGLKLHKDLRDSEESCSDIPDNPAQLECAGVNGNFGRGAHRVLQHRIEILVCGATVDRGGGTIARGRASEGDVRLRPKDVENIYVEGPDADFWAEQYGVRLQDKPRQFDVAMAHELFHAVGVEHHGESDGGIRFEAKSPEEGTDGEYYWVASVSGAGSARARLFDEATGQDITARTARRVKREVYPDLYNLPPQPGDPERESAGIGKTPAYYFTVGFPHGQHSGDESCVMRYWLADIYPKQPGNEIAYYLVPDGTEPVGTKICTGTEGKSINKAGRHPQPRYFEAAPTRGNCKHWVCVNDAIPGLSSNIPEGAP